jgi:hypothetical protein
MEIFFLSLLFIFIASTSSPFLFLYPGIPLTLIATTIRYTRKRGHDSFMVTPAGEDCQKAEFYRSTEPPLPVTAPERVAQLDLSFGLCPVCRDFFDDVALVCDSCSVPHHFECWRDSGKCSIFGCGSERVRVEVLAP